MRHSGHTKTFSQRIRRWHLRRKERPVRPLAPTSLFDFSSFSTAPTGFRRRRQGRCTRSPGNCTGSEPQGPVIRSQIARLEVL